MEFRGMFPGAADGVLMRHGIGRYCEPMVESQWLPGGLTSPWVGISADAPGQMDGFRSEASGMSSVSTGSVGSSNAQVRPVTATAFSVPEKNQSEIAEGLDLLLGAAAQMTDPREVKHEAAEKAIKKKRGRRPTPGMTPEERRVHRLMKNRRTAEVSRQRKLEQTRQLLGENESLREEVARLKANVSTLQKRLRLCSKSSGSTTSPELNVKVEEEYL